MEASPSLPFTILAFLVLLSILVFVHEWGHYIVARLFGVRVEVFSIGFGKEIFGWRDKKDTHWKVSWLPLGGYVKFFGDASAVSNPAKFLERIKPEERDKCFHFKPLWQRALIVAAGPVINLVFAAIVFIGINLAVGQYPYAPPIVGEVTEGMPAAQAGLEPGDKIVEANGKEIEEFSDLQAMMVYDFEKPFHLKVERGNQVLAVTITPEVMEETTPDGKTYRYGRFGITSLPQEVRDYTLWTATTKGVQRVGLIIGGSFDFFRRLFVGNVSMDEVGGPVSIMKSSGQAAEAGIGSFVYFMGAISVMLGFMNLLPIPLLDGGHLLFYSIEAVKGSPVSVKAQEMASMIGLAFILGMLFVVTWNDLKLPGLG